VVSAYTSSIKALKYSRENIGSAQENRGLIAIMPKTRNYSKLPRANTEAMKVSKHTNSHFELDLVKVSPSKETLRTAMVGKAFVHFVCHGKSNEEDPSSSSLILKDGELTVAEISQMPIARGSLAYLSACQTALSRTPKLEDEVITLTSAFQVAGFARVVGTLWNADDETACQVAEEFYAKLEGNIARSVEALDQAVLLQRRKNPDEPSLWASYIYTGA
jgi:CHAT domain-containing protein